ncbi:hypothetical protein ACFFKC_22255 [Pseudoduganella danionis]|uniref:Uncharacterized protein n=1 Tax=Pseudoduganella danionis TaxID=1890295 RepID=A0ABW9SU05_9BURK|nr:hypothetical protein [Pseudoduganella danionis]MTW35512.1 hypothetical protein [Pseudoduganella danionis]
MKAIPPPIETELATAKDATACARRVRAQAHDKVMAHMRAIIATKRDIK